MQAIQFAQFGPPDVLKLVDIAIPQCANSQILVKVRAAGLNPIDYKTRNGSGFVATHLQNHLPASLGYDFAGEVVGVGHDVQGFAVGDHVMGFAGFPYTPCCYAEYLCAETQGVIKKPNNVSFAQAAALPTAGLTALQALNLAAIKQGDRVLIHAGAGGVGHLAIQLAKQQGATVYTTASTQNHAFLTQLGADYCIDYHAQDFTQALQGSVDAVIDLVGGDVGLQSIACLTEKGCIVTVPTITAEKIITAAHQQQRRGMGMLKESNMNELRSLAQLVNDQKLLVEISQQFTLAKAVRAHQQLESGHVRAKLVFVMGEG